MLFWQVKVMVLPGMPDLTDGGKVDPELMSEGEMVRYCRIMHGYLCVVTFMSQSPKFSNGTLLMLANFAGLFLYIFVISRCAIELYDAQPIAFMKSKDTILGTVWLTVEVFTFLGTTILAIIFMILRSCKE